MSEGQWGEYLRAKEPGVREKAYAWKTAIGLQKVDGLTPTEYLVETARRNIEGEITLAESRKLIESYHKSTPVKLETPEGAREGELVPAKREQVREQVGEQVK